MSQTGKQMITLHIQYSQHECRPGQNLDKDVFNTNKTVMLCTCTWKKSTKINFGQNQLRKILKIGTDYEKH